MKEETKKQAATEVVTGVAGFLAGYFWPRKKPSAGGDLVLSDLVIRDEFGNILIAGNDGLGITISCNVENTGANARQTSVVAQIANQFVSQSVNVPAGTKIPIEIQSVLPYIPDSSWNITVSIDPLVKSIALMNPS
jgi:hypothetical protein